MGITYLKIENYFAVMKILMLNPPFHYKYSRGSRSPAKTHSGTIYYPMMLASATGVLEDNGFDVKLVDAPASGQTMRDIEKLVRKFQPDLTVVDTSTPSITNDVNVGEKIKKISGSFVVLVGPHVSSMPEDTLKRGNIDAVARMEYDHTVLGLANALKNKTSLKKVDGLSFKKSGKIIHNKQREFIQNLDELPFVSRIYKKHLNPRDYFFSAAEYPMVMIMSGRGCPFRCFFCNWPQVFYGRKYRLRSAENVVEEFEWITKNLPEVKEIGIEDDTFSANLERVKEICKLLMDKGLNKKIKWWANTRVNLDLESMKLMKKAGCRLIIPGYESGVQEILNSARKGITLEQSKKFTENAKKAGLLVHGCFMVGLPGETKETIRKTVEFAKELNPDTAQFFPLIPYPGTEAYEWAKENGYLDVKDFSDWVTKEGLHNTVLNLPNLSSEELVKYCDWARREYYLRPGYLLYKLKQTLFHPQEAKRTFKSFKTFVKYLIRGSL